MWNTHVHTCIFQFQQCYTINEKHVHCGRFGPWCTPYITYFPSLIICDFLRRLYRLETIFLWWFCVLYFAVGEAISETSRKRAKSECILEKYGEERANEVLAHFVGKEKYDDLKKQFDALLQQFLDNDKSFKILQIKEHQLELERNQMFKDATTLYKWGIVELLLQTFLSQHQQDPENKLFYCYDVNGRENWFNTSFSSVMKHWRCCPLNSGLEILTSYEEGLLKFSDERGRVEWSIDHLYGTISNMLHLKVEESFPIKVIQLSDKSDTLALLTFLKRFYIPFVVAPETPNPPLHSSEAKASSSDDS